jgi:hypothetical protein
MYASWISFLAAVVALKCRWTCDNRCFEAAEEFLTEDMAYRRDIIGIEAFKSATKEKGTKRGRREEELGM